MADHPHGYGEIDHQDPLRVQGVAEVVVLQAIRAPAAGLIVGVDLVSGPRGANGVPLADRLDAWRAGFARGGRPGARAGDGGVPCRGQPPRQCPSRLERLGAGLDIAGGSTRRGRPTDHGAGARPPPTLDGIRRGPPAAGLAAAHAARDAHVTPLPPRCPARATAGGGQPPLVAHPTALPSGRPADPAREVARCALAAGDRVLAGGRWYRRVGPTKGQISFADRTVGVGQAWAGRRVARRFDPTDRQVVVSAPGARPEEEGPEIKRFPCPAVQPAAMRGPTARPAA